VADQRAAQQVLLAFIQVAKAERAGFFTQHKRAKLFEEAGVPQQDGIGS
jgi:hypothetical protein